MGNARSNGGRGHGQEPGTLYPPRPPPPSVQMPLPAPYNHQHNSPPGVSGAEFQLPTVHNDVNLKKETLRISPDEDYPGRFLVEFTFDATVAGNITVYFFAKEELDCNLTAMKPDLLKPATVSFKEGLGQKFRQPSGTGIDLSAFEESELSKQGGMEIYPLAVKSETTLSDQPSEGEDQKKTRTPNSQITQAVFEKKESGDYQVRVVCQTLWVNGTRYELQEIYGIRNSNEGETDSNDPSKECAICLTEPRDTTVLPCRHMCMCSECAKILRYQTTRCPICRQPVKELLEIKVNKKSEEEPQQTSQSPLLPSPPPLHK